MTEDTLRVWDKERKEAVTLPAGAARDGILAGRFVGVRGVNYAFKDDGVMKYVAPENLRQAMRDWRPASTAETKGEAKAYQPEPSALDALRAGAARGTLGAAGVSFDRLVRDAAPAVVGVMGGQDHKAHYTPYAAPTVTSAADRAMGLLERQRSEQALATGAGELGGMAGAALLTGGGIAGAVGRGAAGLGAGRLAATTIGTAVEGAVMADAELDGELARHGEEYTAQAVAAAGGFRNGLMGFAIGGAAGAAGHGLEAAAGALRRSVARGAGDFAHGLAASGRDIGLGRLGTGALPAGVDAAEHAAAVAAATGPSPLIRLAQGEDIFTAAMQRNARGEALSLGGRELLEGIQTRLTNEFGDNLGHILDASPRVLRQTHGEEGMAQWKRMLGDKVTPQVEAAARQLVDDVTAPMRDLVSASREAEFAVQEARAELRTLKAMEAKGGAALERAEREAAGQFAAFEKTKQAAADRLVEAKRALDAAEAKLWTREVHGTANNNTGETLAAVGKRASAAREAFEVASSKYEQQAARAAKGTADAEARLAEVRANVTGIAPEERVKLFQKLTDAEKRAATYHPLAKQEYPRFLDELASKPAPKTDAEWFERLEYLRERHDALGSDAKRLAGTVLASERPLLDASVKQHDAALRAISDQLQDPSLYGKAGEFKRSFNSVRRAQIDAERNMLPGFTIEQEVNGKSRRVVGRDKVRSKLGVNDASHDVAGDREANARSEVKKYLERTRETHELAEKYLDLTPEERATSEAVRQRIAIAESAIADSAENAKHILDLEAAGAFSGKRLGGMSALIGGTLFGAPGVVAGGAAALALDRGQRIAHKSMIVRFTKGVDDRLGTSLMEFWRGRPVGGGASKTASGAFLTGKGGASATFERSSKAIRDAMADPAGLNRMVTQALGGIGETAPGVAMQFAQTIMRGVAYLNNFLPEGMEPDLDVISPYDEPPVYSQSEMLSWARRAAAVNDPLSILAHMRDGTVSEEEIDAVRTVYPDLWSRIEMELAKGAPQQPLDRTQRLALSMVFGMPADRNMKPEVLEYLQMVPAGRAGKGGAVAKYHGPMKMPALRSKSYQTETQKER